MATVTLTPSACSSPAGWTVLYNYLTTNSSYYLRQLLYTYDNSATLAGAGVNITKVTVHGYVRNSNSAVKRLRIGFRPSADSGVSDWAMLDNEAVLDQTFTAMAIPAAVTPMRRLRGSLRATACLRDGYSSSLRRAKPSIWA